VDAVNSAYTNYQDTIAELLASEDALPTLPTITLDIRHALLRQDISVTSLSKLISRDPSLSQILLRYASSVMMHNHMPPQDMFDVVRILGMGQVERIIMVHAVRDLFRGNNQAYTRMFVASWDRLVQKAAISSLIGKKVGRVAPDNALLGSLLSEVGTLAVLGAFKTGEVPVPSREVYVALCREFAKKLGVALLQKWGMDDEYSQLITQVGNWQAGANEPFTLLDAVNLGLYHSLKARMTAQRLPPLASLVAFQKLSDKHNAVTDTQELEIVTMHREDIRAIADSLY
jgi:HD-like signal output (HDOD) protein